MVLTKYEETLAIKVHHAYRCKFCRSKDKTLALEYCCATTTKRRGRWGRRDKFFARCSHCGHTSEFIEWAAILHDDMFGGMDLS